MLGRKLCGAAVVFGSLSAFEHWSGTFSLFWSFTGVLRSSRCRSGDCSVPVRRGAGTLLTRSCAAGSRCPGGASSDSADAFCGELWDLSPPTCAQQSAMNFGILLVQRLVDSRSVTMAAFAAAVSILVAFSDLPVQDFGNAFSTFVAQNYGAGQVERLAGGRAKGNGGKRGLFLPDLRGGGGFCPAPHAHLCAGGRYRGAGCRSALPAGGGRLLCGYWVPLSRSRLLPGGQTAGDVGGSHGDFPGHPGGAGLRVAAGPVGEVGIWMAIPIGWFLADATGYGYYLRHRRALLGENE